MQFKSVFIAFVGQCCMGQLNAQEDLKQPIQLPFSKLEIVDNFATIVPPLEDDIEFSMSSVAWIINNNEFVKSRIGLDSIETCVCLYKEDDYPLIIRKINSQDDSLVVNVPPSSLSPLCINGVYYDRLIHADVSGNPNLLTVPEICRRYTNTPMSKIVVSVNGVILLRDIASYKIAERNILRVNVVSSKDIEGFNEDFVIVKIYTRTSINKKRQIMRLGS